MKGFMLAVHHELRRFFGMRGLPWGCALFAAAHAAYAVAIVANLAGARPAVGWNSVFELLVGGTWLHWLAVFLSTTVLAVRSLAGERRAGTAWLWVTTPLPTWQWALAKLSAASIVWSAVWLPALIWPWVVASLLPAAVSPAWGHLAVVTLGVWGQGVACLALAFAAAACPVGAAAAFGLGFGGLSLLLFGSLLLRDAAWGGAALAIDLHEQVSLFARGVASPAALIAWGAFVVWGTWAASTALDAGRLPRAAIRRACLGLVLGATSILPLVGLAQRIPNVDLTIEGSQSLRAETQTLLGRLTTGVDAWLVLPAASERSRLFDDTRALLERMARRTTALRLQVVDPLGDPGTMTTLIARLGPKAARLSQGGVVLEASARTSVVPAAELTVQPMPTAERIPPLAFVGETVIVRELVALTSSEPRTACVTSGHGELGVAAHAEGHDIAWLETSGFAVRASSAPLQLAGCSVVVIAGPREPFAAAEAIRLDTALRDGARVLALFELPQAPTASACAGLETILSEVGVWCGGGEALDPTQSVGPSLLGVSIDESHPITAGLAGRRVLLTRAAWFRPDAGPRGNAVSVLATTPDATHARGAALVVAATDPSGGRLVAMGSAASFSSAALGQSGSANELLVQGALAWLVGDDASGSSAPTFISSSVSLRRDELVRVAVVTIGVIPLLSLFLGLVLGRRSRTRA